jgi:hypothetical protein
LVDIFSFDFPDVLFAVLLYEVWNSTGTTNGFYRNGRGLFTNFGGAAIYISHFIMRLIEPKKRTEDSTV